MAAAAFGIIAGSFAAWMVITQLMNLTFAWQAGPAIGAAIAAVGITMLFGLIGTFAALGRKPAPVLRNL
jgi:putative ABC transport system permease protein